MPTQAPEQAGAFLLPAHDGVRFLFAEMMAALPIRGAGSETEIPNEVRVVSPL